MENNDEIGINTKQLRNEEPEDEISKLTAENEQPSHMTLRHQNYGGRSEETGLPFNRELESHALDSIYRYTERIKSFLGWEKDREDCELAEESDESISETLEQHCSNSHSAAEGCSLPVETVKGRLSEKETEIDGIHDKISSDSISEFEQCSSSRLGGEDFSDHVSETVDTKITELPRINENGSGFDLEGDSVLYKNNSEQKIFRSEVNIIIADCRSESLTLNVREMDKSLVQDKNFEVGLVLSDADEIIQSELLSSPKREKKDDDREKNMTFGENWMERVNDSNVSDVKETVKCDKMPGKECERKNTLHGEKSLDDYTKTTMDCATKVSSGEINNAMEYDRNSLEGLSNHNEQVNGNDEPFDRSGAPQESEFTEKKNSDAPSPVNNGKHSLEHPTKVIQAKDFFTQYGSLKASVHYEEEKRICCGEKQELSCKENLFHEDDTVCGLGVFKPRWLQSFATPKMYVIIYSIIGILHGSYYSYLIGTISTLEKRFAFKSKVSGAIMVADEITPLLLGVIVGYCAGRSHRPRMVALGMMLSAASCFSSTLPYFIYGPVQHLSFLTYQNHTGPEYCDPGTGNGSCDLDEKPPTLPAVLFLVLGSFLKGFGNLAYYAIGLAYLDDNSDRKTTPIYLAIAMALRLLGPLCGFIMSSAFLKIYENPLDDPGFGPDDPRWIGAWWMGFFLQGVLLVIFTLPIALFPRRLPNQKKIEKFPTAGPENNIKETLAGLLLALKRLGKNPIFIVLIINTNMKIFGHFGHSIMLPKYMENQFRLSAADASLYSGATSITCIMLSTVFGGFLIWKFRPRIKVLLCGMITSEVVLCVGFLVLMIPRCSPADMLHFGTNDDGLILDSVCNQNCDCSTVSFTPFCGPDGKTTYFSPCYAGCTEEITRDIKLPPSNKQKEFGNCSCVNAPDSLVSNPAKITEGFCPDESCWSQTLAYLIILFFLLAISNTLTVAHTMILLRSVHPADKSVALGTFETFICLFGFIPFPITYGALVDSACLVWEESCGETGNCWFYDMEKYAYLLHGASAFFCSMSTICLITLYFLSNRVKNLYVEEDEEEEYIDNIKLDTVSGSVTKL